MPRIFITSDWHFFHDREFVWKVRGFDNVEEMNQAIIDRHNAIVNPDDIVYVLGDCVLGGSSSEVLQKGKELIEQLNGEIHIIRGNHDTDRRVQMYQECLNVASAGSWSDMVKYKGYHFYLCHFPTETGNLEKESLKQCTLCLYGHTHQTSNFYNDKPYMYHVGCDSHNCTPVLLDDIIEEMKEKVKECFEQV